MDFDTLFAEWKTKHGFNAFIRDGVVDPEHYDSPHILFVLRDMNCQSERDLCADLRNDGSGWKTWNNICRWIKALLDGTEQYPRSMPKEERIRQISRVAVMNLKKEGGGSRTDGRALEQAVEDQCDLIREEICLCNPDIIICCGLSSAGMKGNAVLLEEKQVLTLVESWESFHSQSFDREWYYYRAVINGKRIPIISFCHPQVTNLQGARGHDKLFEPLYRDMLHIREMFLNIADGGDCRADEI